MRFVWQNVLLGLLCLWFHHGRLRAQAANGALLVGMGRAEIKGDFTGVGMYGYGKPKNRVEGWATPLFARAMVVEDTAAQRHLAFVSCEVAFVFQAVKDSSLARLRRRIGPVYTEGNTMVTAIHTHAAPGGFAYDALFNLIGNGHHCGVFNALVDAMVEAMEAAHRSRAGATLHYGESTFGDEVEVAYNRSVSAYNANPEHARPVPAPTNLAIDRTMRGLKVVRASDNKAIGLVDWFGVHATCVDNRNTCVSHDNKGHASTVFEREHPGVIALFAQEKAGDVSPNYHGTDKEKLDSLADARAADNGHAHAAANGRVQAAQAHMLFNSTSGALRPTLDHELVYVRMNDAIADPTFADGRMGARTGAACYGITFAKGTTVDGKGGSAALLEFFYWISPNKHKRATDPLRRAQGAKRIFTNAQEGRVLGVFAGNKLARLVQPDLGRQARADALAANAWVQQVLPIQLFTIGELCIIGLPTEITTTAGERLVSTVEKEMRPLGIRHVVLASYANTYAGYTTTQEEYRLQCYEGGHTLFGEWQLAVFRTEFTKLARTMHEPDHSKRDLDRKLRPTFDIAELWKRSDPKGCPGVK